MITFMVCYVFCHVSLDIMSLMYRIWLNSRQIWTHCWLRGFMVDCTLQTKRKYVFNMTSSMAGIIALWLTGYPQKPPGGNLHSNCSHNMEDKSFAWKNLDVIVYNINTVNGDYVFYIDADGYIHLLKAGENIY